MKRIISLCASIVFLASTGNAGSFGTGFAVTPDGHLVTCAHVVNNAAKLVAHYNGKTLAVTVIRVDTQNDLALIKVSGWGGQFLSIADSQKIGIASDVIAAGFPDPDVLGKNPKVSKGIINATSGVQDDPRHFQVSIPLQPGNSGGPVFAPNGQVVGVVAAGLNSQNRMKEGGYIPQSVNYAVKSNYIMPLLTAAGVRLSGNSSASANSIGKAIHSIALIENLAPGERASAPAPALQYSNIGNPAVAPAPAPVRAATPAPVPAAPRLMATQQAAPAPPAPRPSAPASSGPWIFANSHARALSQADLQGLSRDQLWKARNELYVRRGYMFSSAKGKGFAQSFGSNYQPTTSDSEAILNSFNQFEQANLALIQSMER